MQQERIGYGTKISVILILQGHLTAVWAAELVIPGPLGVATYRNHGELECRKEWLILDY